MPNNAITPYDEFQNIFTDKVEQDFFKDNNLPLSVVKITMNDKSILSEKVNVEGYEDCASACMIYGCAMTDQKSGAISASANQSGSVKPGTLYIGFLSSLDQVALAGILCEKSGGPVNIVATQLHYVDGKPEKEIVSTFDANIKGFIVQSGKYVHASFNIKTIDVTAIRYNSIENAPDGQIHYRYNFMSGEGEGSAEAS